MLDDLHAITDDMTAFIAGHGLKRFPGYVDVDELQAIVWDSSDPEGWKDFVELATAAGAKFVTFNEVVLEREELDSVVEQLKASRFPNEDDLDDARWLRTHIGKAGYLQLGFAYHGTMFIYETATEWYERYQRLRDVADEFGGFLFDETGPDDDR